MHARGSDRWLPLPHRQPRPLFTRPISRARPPPRRAFFQETHELYVKVLMDPFYTPGSRIVGRDFDERVRALARRYLGVR